MVYTKKGSIITLEENGLKIFINYDKVMGRIDEEINNSYIYSKGTEDKNLYFFGKKDISQELYIHSLIGIKTLEKLCEVLDMQPGNIIKYVEDNEPKKSLKKC